MAEGRIAAPGRHMVRNAMLAVAVGIEYGVPLEECMEGLRRAKLTKGRLERKMVRGICILDDTYNANPDSMVAALETLGQMPGRRIAVLGQMNELGAESERGHRRVGEAAAREKIDCVITVGSIAERIASAARENGVKHALTPATSAGGGGDPAKHGAEGRYRAHQGEPLGENGNHRRGAGPVMMYLSLSLAGQLFGAKCLLLHHLSLDRGGGDFLPAVPDVRKLGDPAVDSA